MDGHELYALYVAELTEMGVSVDVFDNLEPHDQAAWDNMGLKLQLKSESDTSEHPTFYPPH